MTDLTQAKFTRTSSAERIFLIGLVIWILAQLIRLIAIPLIINVSDGLDALGWMYPAVLDVVAAILAVPLAFAIWKWRGFTVWTLTVIYLTLSSLCFARSSR